MQRDAPSIAGDHEPVARQSPGFHLHPLERTIDIPDRSARAGFFTEHVPWLQRRADLHLHLALHEVADPRETKLEMRREPLHLEGISRVSEVAKNVAQVAFAEVGKHPAVVQIRAPGHKAVCIGLPPKLRHETAKKEVL